jgi:hypothetical protein
MGYCILYKYSVHSFLQKCKSSPTGPSCWSSTSWCKTVGKALLPDLRRIVAPVARHPRAPRLSSCAQLALSPPWSEKSEHSAALPQPIQYSLWSLGLSSSNTEHTEYRRDLRVEALLCAEHRETIREQGRSFAARGDFSCSSLATCGQFGCGCAVSKLWGHRGNHPAPLLTKEGTKRWLGCAYATLCYYVPLLPCERLEEVQRCEQGLY